MTREDFLAFTEAALAEVVALTESRLGTKFHAGMYFRWWPAGEIVRESVAEAIVARVFEGDEAIRPCVDLGVIEVDDDGVPILTAIIAGYQARPFTRNWRGGEGPFVYIVGSELLAGHQRVLSPTLGYSYLVPAPPSDGQR